MRLELLQRDDSKDRRELERIAERFFRKSEMKKGLFW